jgi:hypothetical protein
MRNAAYAAIAFILGLFVFFMVMGALGSDMFNDEQSVIESE